MLTREWTIKEAQHNKRYMCGQQKGQSRAKSHVRLTFFFFKLKKLGISRIPFQIGNSANSATFPQSRRLTGPTTYEQIQLSVSEMALELPNIVYAYIHDCPCDG